MKKNYLLIIFCFITFFANAQAPFITTWSVLGGDTIIVPIVEDDDNPDSYTIDFGDGTILTNQSGETSHTYENAGIYTVTISGNFTRIKFVGNTSNPSRLSTIEQWGDIQWTNMEKAFSSCDNLTIMATDAPDLSNVTDVSYMFSRCFSLNQNISYWDVSNITNMSYMFSECDSFNQPVNTWNVSNVTDMRGMFYNCHSFNQPINTWDVSNVTDMRRMFYNCYSFNQSINTWDVSNVTNMLGMFYWCNSFNQSLNTWDVSNVTDMSLMFARALNFNQPLNNWNVSNVTDMSSMFGAAVMFNQPIGNWDVSNVIDMSGMFASAELFNQPIDNWNVSNVTDMSSMFFYSASFNQPLNSWNTSNVVDMEAMFWQTSSFNYPINNWDVSNVIKMGSMFFLTFAFNQDLSDWNFNTNVTFENLEYPQFDYTFLGQSGLDVNNYDALLNRFKELGLENKNIGAEELQYCDEETRTYLINELGWSITGDSLAEDCTAVTESFTKEQVSIYPNPVNNILHIETNSGIQLEAITVYNLQGSQLIQQSQDLENINTEGLSSGIYLLSIQTNKGSTEYKLIKN